MVDEERRWFGALWPVTSPAVDAVDIDERRPGTSYSAKPMS
jgi:hypothetical protein